MTGNNRARNSCKRRETGLYVRHGQHAPKVNLVDAEWTSRNWSSVPDSKTGMGYQSIGGSNPPSPLNTAGFPAPAGKTARVSARLKRRDPGQRGPTQALSYGSSFPPPFPPAPAAAPEQPDQ